MKKVAIGRTAGGAEQAVGIRCRQEWHRHKMSREQLVGTTGQRVQADGDKEVLMEGQEIWEEWTGQTVGDTEWRREVKGQWRAREQAVVRRGWNKNLEQDKDKVERDKVYDRQRLSMARDMGEGEPWLLLAMFGHTSITLY